MGTRTRTALLAVSAPLVALALIEGCVAIGRLVRLGLGANDPLEHTRYDAELGWSHVPGFASEDYSAAGHRFVATRLRSRLESRPGFAASLAAAGGAASESAARP